MADGKKYNKKRKLIARIEVIRAIYNKYCYNNKNNKKQ
jgi:hypothetical protein